MNSNIDKETKAWIKSLVKKVIDKHPEWKEMNANEAAKERHIEDEMSDLVEEKIPITVDFDATLCYPHAYPNILNENKPCFDVLRKWQKMGCMIILNTMRGGNDLQEAIDWCKEKSFEFDAVGRNPTQDKWCGNNVYKCYSVLDIDDRNAGVPLIGEDYDGRGWVDWNRIDKVYTPKLKKMTKMLIKDK